MQLLRGILDLLFPPRDAERLVHEATEAVLDSLVRVHAHEDGSVSLLPYRAPLVTACITEAKFRDSERAQRLLASVLSGYLATLTGERFVLVPVSLSAKRLRERGYNQAERIGRLALAELSVITLGTGILSRVRDTLPQTSLGGRARRENLAGAFVASVPDASHTYIVFDDVRTTGATLADAVRALRDAGAMHVLALSLAH